MGSNFDIWFSHVYICTANKVNETVMENFIPLYITVLIQQSSIMNSENKCNCSQILGKIVLKTTE